MKPGSVKEVAKYLEAHVIVRRRKGLTFVGKSQAEAALDALVGDRPFGWWSSTLEKDNGDDEAGDLIMTNRFASEQEAIMSMSDLVDYVQHGHITLECVRAKLESCIMDTKIEDSYGILGG